MEGIKYNLYIHELLRSSLEHILVGMHGMNAMTSRKTPNYVRRVPYLHIPCIQKLGVSLNNRNGRSKLYEKMYISVEATAVN